MMKFTRNPEVRRAVVLNLLLSAAAVAAAYTLDSKFALFTLAVCCAFMLLNLIVTHRRYKRIQELSSDIDRILHGGGEIKLDRYSEGELAILQSEIYKMTVRLREQQQRLQDDKIYLADSLADISHQIRTPLTSINLLVSLLSEPEITDVERAEHTRELYGLLSRIDWLITTLLKISKLDAGTVELSKQTVPLRALIEKAAAPVLIPMELRGQTLSVTAEGELDCDTSWTSEALTNIIKNCMEHTPDGGKIEITASGNALYSQITVSDNGGGIAPEDLPHIFERFYKGKDSDEKSFGIGLALARMIITSQNGTVKATNSPDGGAVFTIRFYKGTI